jgi:hypothetical protein
MFAVVVATFARRLKRDGGCGAAALQRKAIAASGERCRLRHCALFISFCRCCVESKRGRMPPVKYWEIIADNLSKGGWSWDCVSDRVIVKEVPQTPPPAPIITLTCARR